MKIENPRFTLEPGETEFPFLRRGRSYVDSIIRVKIDGNVCDVYLCAKHDWKIIGVINPNGEEFDKKELRDSLIEHPNLRLLYLTG